MDRYVDHSIAKSRFVKNPIITDEVVEDLLLGKVDDRLVEKMRFEYGLDISGKEHVLTDNDIRHMYNRHGPHTPEALPITPEDIKKIPTIIAAADEVYYLPRKDGKTGLMYQYRHNGTTFFLEQIVGDELRSKQMIKVPTGTIPDVEGLVEAVKAKSSNPLPGDAARAVPQMYVQDVRSGAFLNVNIPQNQLSVNPEGGETGADTAMDLAVEMLAGQGEAAPLEEAAEVLAGQGETPALERTAPLMSRDAKWVMEFSKTLGRAGATAFTQMYDPSISAEQYIKAMTAYYNAGMNEGSMAAVYQRLGDVVTPQQASAAYMAGQADRATSLNAEKETAAQDQIIQAEDGGKAPDQSIEQKPKALSLSDISINRSLGAKAKNYEVVDKRTGVVYHFLEGTHLQNVEVFAGSGVRVSLRQEVAEGLAQAFGGEPGSWQHVKGIGELTSDGEESRRAEVHWFQAAGFDKVKFYVKRWLEE